MERPQYIGFTTINADKQKSVNMPMGNAGGVGGIVRPVIIGKKYRLIDEQLIIQDFINAMNIKRGEKVGQPGYGTTLWDFVFEPNSPDMQYALEAEIQRIAKADARLEITELTLYTSEHGVLIEVGIKVRPFVSTNVIKIFFNEQTGEATEFVG